MIKIRTAVRQDIPRILALYEELAEAKQNPPPGAAENAFLQIESMPGHELLVVESDGLVIGTIIVQTVPSLSHNARPWMILENFVVDSRYRGQGIGRQMMDYVLKHAREANCYKVQLMSMKKRLDAHRFYRNIGFEDSALGFRIYF